MELRYSSDMGKIESKEYIEKLFPMVFSLPPKTDDDVSNYIDSLVPIDDKYAKLRSHLIKSLTSNPRKIKRMLNMIFFLIQNYDLDNCYTHPESSTITEYQLHFSLIITWVSLTINHRKISGILQTEPSAFIPVVLLAAAYDSFTEFKDACGKFDQGHSPQITKDDITHVFHHQIITSSIDDILKIIVKEDKLAFKTLKQTSKFIKKPEEFNPQDTVINYVDAFISNGYSGVSEIF